MTDKTMRFEGKGMDLDELSNDIMRDLMKGGYDVQSNTAPNSIVIQARKEGVLRDIFAANRAFTIMIDGTPNDFTVRIGVGKFMQNLAVMAAEALVLSELFLAIDVPEAIWTREVENGIAKNISSRIEGESADMEHAPVNAKPSKSPTPRKKGS